MNLPIDIHIDIITNSIVNTVSGDIFNTEINPIEEADLKTLKKGWAFDWLAEKKINKVFKLTVEGNPQVIQGLVSIIEKESYIYINLIESASFNIGKSKLYSGVAGNLFAFACKLSFDYGFGGYVSFLTKSQLKQHYKKMLGAKSIGNSDIMIIEPQNAKILINKYYGM